MKKIIVALIMTILVALIFLFFWDKREPSFVLRQDVPVIHREPVLYPFQDYAERPVNELQTVILPVERIIQETSFYCVPATLQSVLRYHKIEVSQETLAKEMNTDPITGTEYLDLVNTANRYIFGNDVIGPTDPGYRVVEYSQYNDDIEIMKRFEEVTQHNINNGDPTFVAVG